jgi:hypothetical protein
LPFWVNSDRDLQKGHFLSYVGLTPERGRAASAAVPAIVAVEVLIAVIGDKSRIEEHQKTQNSPKPSSQEIIFQTSRRQFNSP